MYFSKHGCEYVEGDARFIGVDHLLEYLDLLARKQFLKRG